LDTEVTLTRNRLIDALRDSYRGHMITVALTYGTEFRLFGSGMAGEVAETHT